MCPKGYDCNGSEQKSKCKVHTFAKEGDGDCTACPQPQRAAQGSGECQQPVALALDGTCDPADPTFFAKAQEALQDKASVVLKSSARGGIFCWKIACPDGTFVEFADDQGKIKSLTSASPASAVGRRRLNADNIKITAHILAKEPQEAAAAAQALQVIEDSGELKHTLTIEVNGYQIRVLAFTGLDGIERNKGSTCHFCKGHQKTLDDLVAKVIGTDKYTFNIIIDATTPLSLEVFTKTTANGSG